MAFTFTINGNVYTSDPANVTAGATRRFIGYGYITALALLVEDIIAVAAAVLTNKEDAEQAVTDAVQAKDLAVIAKNAAETALDNMDDRYLGSKAADPAVDNDGNALTDGAYYFNTTAKAVKFYDLATATWYAPPTTSAGLLQKAGDTMTGALNMADQQLVRALLKDSAAKFVDLGASGTAAQVLDHELAHHFKSTATGNHTVSFSNWPATDTGFIVYELVNGGAFAVTLPTINFVKPDGTTTTSLGTYLTALGISGRTTLQSAGTDIFLLMNTANGTPRGVLLK
jgi:hypothetical protein